MISVISKVLSANKNKRTKTLTKHINIVKIADKLIVSLLVEMLLLRLR